ncbi:hypothetical protein V6M85_14090 (plasmid) [Sulfolobus tengchongensis]|uniref:Uncharacterized protein n=2 Tax=Sulfolobus tengchongensis TaxID=207809 RepID=A0AAX4L4A4_9CREN
MNTKLIGVIVAVIIVISVLVFLFMPRSNTPSSTSPISSSSFTVTPITSTATTSTTAKNQYPLTMKIVKAIDEEAAAENNNLTNATIIVLCLNVTYEGNSLLQLPENYFYLYTTKGVYQWQQLMGYWIYYKVGNNYIPYITQKGSRVEAICFLIPKTAVPEYLIYNYSGIYFNLTIPPYTSYESIVRYANVSTTDPNVTVSLTFPYINEIGINGQSFTLSIPLQNMNQNTTVIVDNVSVYPIVFKYNVSKGLIIKPSETAYLNITVFYPDESYYGNITIVIDVTNYS